MLRRPKLLFLALCKYFGLFRLARRLSRDKLKILCYHGFALADEAQFRPRLFITPEIFRQRLAVIARHGMLVLPLSDAVRRLYDRSLPSNALAITIDDGFHSVYGVAVSELQRMGFPSTVYVTSYYVKHATPVFTLAVQYMFWKTTLQRVDLQGLEWWPDGELNLADAQRRKSACDACIAFGETVASESDRVRLCERLGELLRVDYQDLVAKRLLHLMKPDELRMLRDAGMDVQLHTHRHHFPIDDASTAVREIEQNRKALSGWLPGPFVHFCYPSGLWHERQFAWLDGAGVESSTTCLPGLNSAATPRHALRRFLDSESIHPLEFESALSGFSDLLRRS